MDLMAVKEKKTFSQKLAEQDFADYEKHYFDLEKFGGATEADSIISRYQQQGIELREQDKEILRKNAPEGPKFEILNRDQYKKQSCFKKPGYKTKVRKYFEYRRDFFLAKKQKVKDTDPDAVEYTKLREDIESGEYYQKSPAARQMDETFNSRRNDNEFKETERINGEEECNNMLKSQENAEGNLKFAFETYTGGGYTDMNNLARSGWPDPNTQAITDYMTSHPINRDLVVRRAVRGVNTLVSMLGGKSANGITANEIKKNFKELLKSNRDVILSDKGFVSTSLPTASTFYDAGLPGGDDDIGIEFMILCKKGTAAMNVQSISTVPDESELLLAPGTKFKVVDAQLDGRADILAGNKKSWKIYLETIPVSQEGVKKEAA